MSENKKMSSPYAVLGNRPIDQWKVTELKEELKKRKLSTKGLKEELVKRLDEAVRSDNEDAQMNDVASLDSASQAEVQSENAVTCPSAVDTTDGILDNGENITDKLDIDNETVDCGNNEAVSQKVDTDVPSLDSASQAEVQSENAVTCPSAVDTTDGILDNGENITDKLDIDNETVDCGNNEAVSQKVDTDVPQADVDGGLGSLAEESIGEFVGETNVAGAECLQVVEETSVETTVTVETAVTVSESMVSETAFSGQDLQNSESEIKYKVSNLVQDTLDSKPPHEELKLNSSDVNIQVAEASQVKSDSISIDTVSITEKNELKDSVIADDVILEVDVIPAQPSSNNPVLDGGNLQPIDIDEPHSNKVTVGNNDVIKDENADTGKKIVCGDVGSPEKLNLDRSSGDDSMEEDPLESKQVDSKLGSDDIDDKSEKVDASVDKEDTPLDAMVEDTTADKKMVNVENQNGLAAASVKRKLHEQEAAGNTDLTKRQRRWNSESLKVPEPQGSNISASNTPKDAVQPAIKRNFSRSNSAVADETPKERVVPPSPKTPTNSLRIDRFLRPFTLKAVQELLGKTGSVTSFWMDHIKTHCYVTYSSIEEAIETRNAVYNLQWPTNGGRLLLAEFVDPQEVKNRLEAPLPSPTTPASTTPTLPPPPQAPMQPPQPSPRLQVQRQQQQQQLPPPPPLPLPPPPPLSNPPLARERLLPPPPPLPEKVDPPIVTLDDLFRKTRATPRIYYLPLSEEQVAEKLKAHGKTTKQ